MKHFLVLLTLGYVFVTHSQIQELKNNSDKARHRLQVTKLQPAQKVNKFLDFVNPFIGTGGHGHTFPGPVYPFGMVQVGPDTRYDGWDGCSGYHFSDAYIYGFSHTHLSGTGVSDYADVLVVPQQGQLNLVPGYKSPKGFKSAFNHDNEIAKPGYYRVRLDNGIEVELTASKRAALHKYRFVGGNDKKYLVIDLGYRDKVLDVSAVKNSNSSIQGKRISEAWAKKQHLYFYLETSLPFSKGKWIADKKTGNYLFVLEFPKTTQEVLVKVGISGVDENGAKNNVQTEIPDFNFASVQHKAMEAWENELGKIKIETKFDDLRSIFYTALYHTSVHPSLWSDADGRYRDFNEQIKTSNTEMYSVFSLWDTYRATHPLYTITQVERTKSFVESFYQQFVNTKLLPMWPLSNNETNCMIGYHAASVIADAYLKGIEIGDGKKLLDAMIQTSNANHLGIPNYVQNGFISADVEAESVSKTLEYAYDDWCISLMASKLGETEIAKEYAKRASSWMNVIHPESHFFQPRKNGVFLPNFKPNEVNHHYTEANAWQYSMAAPQHILSLIDMHGGNETMEKFLDEMFTSSSEMSGRDQVDITGLIGQYAHGNEPSHHIAYLYNYCAKPWKTQFYIDSILKSQYTTKPDGLSGNEDCGQMSAWYVMSAMGFYPVAPGSTTYALGRPLFDYLRIPNGKNAFELIAKNNAPENKYIQSMTWNNEAYQKMYITHEMLVSGGKLEIEMGPTPNENLRNYELDLRGVVPADFVPVPFFTTPKMVFEQQLEVNLDVLFFEKGTIYYALDGKKFMPLYQNGGKGILLDETTTIYAKVVRKNGAESKTIKTTFTKYERNKSIQLKTQFANQYAASGAQALVDGQVGSEEYRGTEWQGFQGKNVEGVIQLNESKEISTLIVSFLQDPRSWIFPPKSLAVEVSLDGVTFKNLGKLQGFEVKPTDGLKIGKLQFDFPPTLAKYIRFTVENAGPCPEWHLGAGGETWLFLDEIDVK